MLTCSMFLAGPQKTNKINMVSTDISILCLSFNEASQILIVAKKNMRQKHCHSFSIKYKLVISQQPRRLKVKLVYECQVKLCQKPNIMAYQHLEINNKIMGSNQGHFRASHLLKYTRYCFKGLFSTKIAPNPVQRKKNLFNRNLINLQYNRTNLYLVM